MWDHVEQQTIVLIYIIILDGIIMIIGGLVSELRLSSHMKHLLYILANEHPGADHRSRALRFKTVGWTNTLKFHSILILPSILKSFTKFSSIEVRVNATSIQ